jgi:hypothetical protein
VSETCEIGIGFVRSVPVFVASCIMLDLYLAGVLEPAFALWCESLMWG